MDKNQGKITLSKFGFTLIFIIMDNVSGANLRVGGIYENGSSLYWAVEITILLFVEQSSSSIMDCLFCSTFLVDQFVVKYFSILSIHSLTFN